LIIFFVQEDESKDPSQLEGNEENDVEFWNGLIMTVGWALGTIDASLYKRGK
jgi:hypothetical protein